MALPSQLNPGDLFGLILQLTDATTGDGVPISTRVRFTASITNLKSRMLLPLVVTHYTDQVSYPGCFTVTSTTPTHLAIGSYIWLVRAYVDDALIYSRSDQFSIVPDDPMGAP